MVTTTVRSGPPPAPDPVARPATSTAAPQAATTTASCQGRARMRPPGVRGTVARLDAAGPAPVPGQAGRLGRPWSGAGVAGTEAWSKA
jgi:hypothetical protein